jgi:hypothetical protein
MEFLFLDSWSRLIVKFGDFTYDSSYSDNPIGKRLLLETCIGNNEREQIYNSLFAERRSSLESPFR